MRPVGIHYLGEFFDCSYDFLNDASRLTNAVEHAITEEGFTLIDTVSYNFHPVGVTVVAVIGESHIAIHSYPEACHITIDVFTCSGNPRQLFFRLKEVFNPNEFKFRKFFRGKELIETESNMVVTSSNYGLDVQYSVSEWLHSERTKYQKVDIIKNPQFGKMVFLDNNLQLSEYDHDIYDSALLKGIDSYSCNSRVLILGGGDGTLKYKIENRGYENVDLVDIDREFVEISSELLCDMNGGVLRQFDRVYFEDAFAFLQHTRDKYDVIISDMTVHPESFTTLDRKDYFTSLFEAISKALRKGGMFKFQCSSIYNVQSYELFSKLLANYFIDVEFTTVYIPSYCKEWLFGKTCGKVSDSEKNIKNR